MKETLQSAIWTKEFGKEYTDRNTRSYGERNQRFKELIGIERSVIDHRFLGDLDRSISVLEIGANIGLQLYFLQKMGFVHLNGIDVQDYAIAKATELFPGINIIRSTALDIPYEKDSFDLVYTSVVLIHISPSDIDTVLAEIYRVSRKYIWGYEYYYPDHISIKYRGHEQLLWKGDFCAMYLKNCSDLRLVKREKFMHIGNKNVDEMFLLEKV